MQENIKIRIAEEEGFSLIELMVVIVILGLLAGLVAPRVMDRIHDGKVAKAQTDIASMSTALKLYKVDNGAYPSTEQGLQALVEAPAVPPVPRRYRENGYLEQTKVPRDPWGNDYLYLCPGAHGDFDIVSYGPDGLPGGDSKNRDIANWEADESAG